MIKILAQELRAAAICADQKTNNPDFPQKLTYNFVTVELGDNGYRIIGTDRVKLFLSGSKKNLENVQVFNITLESLKTLKRSDKVVTIVPVDESTVRAHIRGISKKEEYSREVMWPLSDKEAPNWREIFKWDGNPSLVKLNLQQLTQALDAIKTATQCENVLIKTTGKESVVEILPAGSDVPDDVRVFVMPIRFMRRELD